MFSTRKSSSGWLDRIRTAKGFPENSSTDLEDFLQNPTTCTTLPISDPKRNQDNQPAPPKQQLVNVLHELFNFGDNGSNSANFKKCARKQANPRVCASVDNRNNVASELLRIGCGDANNAGVERVKELEEVDDDDDDDDGRDYWDLPGFSKTEVTVIDTSYECWKFDKLLFRKKNVWKVRDKKSGSVKRSTMKLKKKKRKGVVDDGECSNKKRKLDMKGSDKSEAYEKGPDKVKKVLKKKQPDSKMENGSSSIILIKSLPTSKKSGTNISKSSLGK